MKIAKVEDMAFVIPNEQIEWRVETLYSKEPSTIDWINNIPEGDVVYDVGANIGLYSILLAKRGCRVYAFEPESQNYAVLCQNIILNNVVDNVTAYCLGLTDARGFGELYLSKLGPGHSCHTAGERLNYNLEPYKTPYKQGCVMATLIEVSQYIGTPKHIKIDVDGFEHRVIDGAREVWHDVNSASIELNLNLQEHREAKHLLFSLGFKIDAEQVEKAMRKDGPFQGTAEHVFYK